MAWQNHTQRLDLGLHLTPLDLLMDGIVGLGSLRIEGVIEEGSTIIFIIPADKKLVLGYRVSA